MIDHRPKILQPFVTACQRLPVSLSVRAVSPCSAVRCRAASRRRLRVGRPVAPRAKVAVPVAPPGTHNMNATRAQIDAGHIQVDAQAAAALTPAARGVCASGWTRRTVGRLMALVPNGNPPTLIHVPRPEDTAQIG